jgi:hypothetical protein
VQLIDATTDEHLWAERYDRTLDDAFAIQSDVAQRVVAVVGAALGGAERQAMAEAPTADPEAYRLYLQGLEYYARPGFSRQNWEVAQQLYERAIALDAEFALARAALSEVHGAMYWWRYDPSPERAVRQREEAEAALRLSPDLPQAHLAMGLVHYWGRREYRRALDAFAVAREGLPNDAWVVGLIGSVHRRLGNWDDVVGLGRGRASSIRGIRIFENNWATPSWSCDATPGPCARTTWRWRSHPTCTAPRCAEA